VSQDIIVHVHVEPDEPCEPRDDRDELDDVLELTLETDVPTPEEAGYGHGV
jgi:hypothetical protein